tara:strand:+ start:304 stop:873 length:570 start_codon:yes stop_codon:yes gene_type:complete
MARNTTPVYSECCNAFPAFQEPTICHKCGQESKFYDLSDTITRPEGMSTEEYIEYARKEKGGLFNEDSKFDVDLKYGQIREQLFADIMEGKELVEVKTERGKWKSTGNIAIEWMSRGKLSGIAATKADWWAHFLADDEKTEAVIIMAVPELKRRIKALKKLGIAEDARGGDDDTSRLVLLPLNQLFGDV